MRRSVAAVAALAAAGASLVAVSAAGASSGAAGTKAAAPKISFRQDAKKPGFYVVTVTPASRLRATLYAWSGCDFSGTTCKDSIEIDSELLPKAATHSVSWGIAKWWSQPAADAEGGLPKGKYRIVLAVPGTKSKIETTFFLGGSGGGD